MGLAKLTVIPQIGDVTGEEWPTDSHLHPALPWMSDLAEEFQRHLEWLLELQGKFSEGISEVQEISKALLQAPLIERLKVRRLERQVESLQKELQEKTVDLQKARRALQRKEEKQAARQSKEEEEQAGGMGKASVLQQQLAQLQEEKLSHCQQLSHVALRDELKAARDKIVHLTLELEVESQKRQQLAAKNQELQELLVAQKREQAEQRGKAHARVMELISLNHQLGASAVSATRQLKDSSSFRVTKLEEKNRALEKELERARSMQKEMERQLAREKAAREAREELYQRSKEAIRVMKEQLDIRGPTKSDRAEEFHRHSEWLLELQEKFSEGISEVQEISKSLLQAAHIESLKVRRLERQVESLQKELQEKTVDLQKARRALQRKEEKQAAHQSKEEEEEAGGMKKASVLQQQLTQLQEEKLSLCQQLSHIQNGGQEEEQIMDASAVSAMKQLKDSSSLRFAKLEEKNRALEKELERARSMQKEMERQLAREKAAREAHEELYQRSKEAIRVMKEQLDIRGPTNSDRAEEFHKHSEWLLELQEKFSEGISEVQEISKALLQAPLIESLKVRRLERQAESLQRELQEKTVDLQKARRALQRKEEKQAAHQSKEEEEEAGGMKKASVLQQQLTQLQEEKLSLCQQVNHM
ncbi:trichohyalin-like [Pogoniulus pusillus]|uniref:trichohyalin-like n=1 Tax=Pogoniulus pusillus TaxID=488313 RepID=UPI0030B98271